MLEDDGEFERKIDETNTFKTTQKRREFNGNTRNSYIQQQS
jgi:hypothetical protein